MKKINILNLDSLELYELPETDKRVIDGGFWEIVGAWLHDRFCSQHGDYHPVPNNDYVPQE